MSAFFLFLLLIVVQANATVRLVNASATGANNGSSWSNAYTSLATALSASSNGDEIWVAAGTYYPTSGSDRTISFLIPSGVKVYGGFAGIESSLTERDYRTYISILSGDIGVQGTNTDNSYHVVKFSGVSATTRIDGFTITKGYANGSSPHNSGGGIWNAGSATGSNPIVENCIIELNYADRDGGGIFSDANGSGNAANITIKKSAIMGNTASTHNGGGIEIYGWVGTSSATIENCQITGNKSFSFGGGIEFAGGYAGSVISGTVNFCTISGNRNGSSGSGIYTQIQTGSLSLTVKNSIVFGNGSTSGSAQNIENNAAGKTTILYSQVANCTSSNWYTTTKNTDGGQNSDLDPLFSNAVISTSAPTNGGDYSLTASSPCLGTGDPDPQVVIDLTGAARPLSPARGSYELGSLLPVTWLGLHARCNDAKTSIDWSTLEHQKNVRYIIERSTNGSVWISVGAVQSSYESTGTHSYRFEDNYNGTAQYRLIQIDPDGRSSQSPIVKIRCNGTTKQFRAYPNPATDMITLENIISGSRFRLLNSLGKIIRQGLVSGNMQRVSLSGLNAGHYIIIISQPSGESYSQPIQILR